MKKKKLDPTSITTRGTRRQRLPKGFVQEIRYQVLRHLPEDKLETALEGKLQRLSPERRQEVESELDSITGEMRRKRILGLLSQT